MRAHVLAATVGAFLAFVLAGCGGGNRTAAGSGGIGRAVVTATWPDRSRLIPAASSSITATFRKDGTVIASQVIPRPAHGNTATALFNNLKVGSLTLEANAYPNADGTGVAQAHGTVPVTILSGGTMQVTLTMASTIDHLEMVPPANPQVMIGHTVQLAAVGRNAAGWMVLLAPSRLAWSSSDPSMATVDAAGTVTGARLGTPTITVMDTESGKSTTTTVTVVTRTYELLISSHANNLIKVFDGSTGLFKSDLIDTAASGLSGPQDIALGPDGSLYVAGYTSSNVNRYDPSTGALLDAYVPPGAGSLASATSLSFMADGSLLVGSAANNKVIRYRYTGGGSLEFGAFAQGSNLNAPAASVFGPDGRLYVSSSGATSGVGEIKRFDGATGAFIDNFVTSGSGGLIQPEGIAFGPDGNLYVCDWGADAVKRYSGNSGSYIDDFVPRLSGGMIRPYCLTFGPDGDLYVGCGPSMVKRYNGTTGAFAGDFLGSRYGDLAQPTFLLFRPVP